MRKHIQDRDPFYTFLKFFVDWSVRSSFRKYQVEGMENLPKDGSVIWAANHTNALMDPMVMLSSSDVRKVCVARADIFKKKWAIKALYFLRVMPIYRIRDGINAVKHNDESCWFLIIYTNIKNTVFRSTVLQMYAKKRTFSRLSQKMFSMRFPPSALCHKKEPLVGGSCIVGLEKCLYPFNASAPLTISIISLVIAD